MVKITIEIEVLNPEEVIRHQKGKVMASLAVASLSKKSLKKKVETEVCKEVISNLKKNLDQAFKSEGIAAHLKITTESED